MATTHTAQVWSSLLLHENSCALAMQVEEGKSAPHPLWRKAMTLDGMAIWVNPFSGRLSRHGFPAPELCPGGILCDEMGLGKTVELLACIAANPMPDRLKVRCGCRIVGMQAWFIL